MITLKTKIKKYVPEVIFDFLYKIKRIGIELLDYDSLKKNKRFKNIHLGERCFILGNASSLNNHNLKKLAGEKIFSVSYGYLHPDYPTYKPQFHCLPQLTLSNADKGLNEKKASQFLNDIFKNTMGATLFLHKGIKKVNYATKYSHRDVCFIGTSAAAKFDNKIDLTRYIYPIQSVPQMAISVALYMGFKEIYLLGVEHDELCSLKYEYFFNRSKIIFSDPDVDESNKLKIQRLHLFKTYVKLFEGYDRLKKIANNHGCKIYNCSSTSFLDVYSLVNFDKLFK